MALTATVLVDAYITINANVLSDHGNKVELNATVVDLDTTAFGQTWQNRLGGLLDGTLAIDFLNDFTAAAIDSIIWPLFIARVPVPFEVRPTSAARSVSNPGWSGNLMIKEWKPISGKVGDLSVASVSWPTSGVVTRATS